MSKTRLFAILAPIALFLTGCSNDNHDGPLSAPPEATVDLSDSTPNKFDSGARQTLLSYFTWQCALGSAGGGGSELCGSSRGCKRQVRNDNEWILQSGKQRLATKSGNRLFREALRSWKRQGNYTKAAAGTNAVKLVIEGAHSGEPGNSSFLTVEGSGVFVEIFDQAPETERAFTQRAYNEVCRELSDVLKHQDEIRATGKMPVDSWYPISTPGAPSFEVRDGLEPGIYVLSAFVSPKSPGIVYVKVFNSNSGARLSKSSLKKESTRWVGWSESGSRLYPYNTEATIYEGNWNTKCEARFELWHCDEQGKETKLIEKSRLINGWQR